MTMLTLLKCSVLWQIIWDADAWKEVNDDTLNIPGCVIPTYDFTYSKDQTPITPPCHRLIEVEKISADRIRFIMRKQMDSCCYSFVQTNTGGEDQEMRFTPCVPLKDQTETKLISDIINVECDSDYETIYEDTYFVVKPVEAAKNKTSVNTMGNVLIIAIESVSRARAYSTLPRSIQFFHRNDWFDFRGYNTIDNAVLTVLTGMTSCYNVSCVPLWLRYQRAGYVTATNQEALEFSNIEEKPTHYISPYSLADEINCTRQTADRTLDYAFDFVMTYKSNFFGFFQFKKDVEDNLLANFITKLTLSGVLYNTFVFIVSNGREALSSQDNFYNARLPLFFMWTPTTFRNNYKTHFSFLKLNQWRLVSPFDLHLTALNILGTQQKLPECPKCKSLFERISEFRHCVDAGIDKIWCACFDMVATNLTDYGMKYSIIHAISDVINKTQSLQTDICMSCKNVTFKNLLRSHYYMNKTATYYVVAFTMDPHVALEVSLRKYLVNEEFVYEVIDVDVIDKGVRGKCVVDKDSLYKNICYCEANAKCFVTWFLTAELLRRNAKLSKFGTLDETESSTVEPKLFDLSGLSPDITAK